jgi:predicted nucleic acid-binding protein
MRGSVFLDTNILVYAIEVGGPASAKTAAARALVRRSDVCLSTQVLGEFYRAVTSRRRAVPLTHEEALVWVQFWKRHDVRAITVPHVDLALEIAARFQTGYFDALILAAARLAGCATVYSEDLAAGQDYDGVRVENPLSA